MAFSKRRREHASMMGLMSEVKLFGLWYVTRRDRLFVSLFRNAFYLRRRSGIVRAKHTLFFSERHIRLCSPPWSTTAARQDTCFIRGHRRLRNNRAHVKNNNCSESIYRRAAKTKTKTTRYSSNKTTTATPRHPPPSLHTPWSACQ